jgi:hypothetical protein
MLEEPVYNTCSSNPSSVAKEDSFSLTEITDYIRGLGVPDTLAGLEPLIEDGRF